MRSMSRVDHLPWGGDREAGDTKARGKAKTPSDRGIAALEGRCPAASETNTATARAEADSLTRGQ